MSDGAVWYKVTVTFAGLQYFVGVRAVNEADAIHEFKKVPVSDLLAALSRSNMGHALKVEPWPDPKAPADATRAEIPPQTLPPNVVRFRRKA